MVDTSTAERLELLTDRLLRRRRASEFGEMADDAWRSYTTDDRPLGENAGLFTQREFVALGEPPDLGTDDHAPWTRATLYFRAWRADEDYCELAGVIGDWETGPRVPLSFAERVAIADLDRAYDAFNASDDAGVLSAGRSAERSADVLEAGIVRVGAALDALRRAVDTARPVVAAVSARIAARARAGL